MVKNVFNLIRTIINLPVCYDHANGDQESIDA